MIKNLPKEHKFTALNNGKSHTLSCVEWGDPNNSNVLLCVHSLTGNNRDFDYIADQLCDKYRIISLDVVGRGKSDWIDPILYNFDTYTQDIFTLFEYFQLKTVDWLGTSMGGLIGMYFSSIAHEDAIKTMILNDVGAFIPQESLSPIAKYVGLNPQFKDLNHATEYMRMARANTGIYLDEDWTYLAQHSIMDHPEYGLTLAYDPQIATNFTKDVQDIDLKDFWNKEVKFDRAIILHGGASEILSKDTVEFMKNTKANVESITFDDIKHPPALMDQSQIHQLLNKLNSI